MDLGGHGLQKSMWIASDRILIAVEKPQSSAWRTANLTPPKSHAAQTRAVLLLCLGKTCSTHPGAHG